MGRGVHITRTELGQAGVNSRQMSLVTELMRFLECEATNISALRAWGHGVAKVEV